MVLSYVDVRETTHVLLKECISFYCLVNNQALHGQAAYHQ